VLAATTVKASASFRPLLPTSFLPCAAEWTRRSDPQLTAARNMGSALLYAAGALEKLGLAK
jgi:hypothetical protein